MEPLCRKVTAVSALASTLARRLELRKVRYVNERIAPNLACI